MINLINGQENPVCVTLDGVNSPTASYLWKIVRKGSFEEVIFTAQNNSWAPYVFNSFTFSLGQTISATAGVFIANNGEWDYTVYASEFLDNLSLTQSLTEIEVGIMLITGTYTANTEYTGNDRSTISYYKNQ